MQALSPAAPDGHQVAVLVVDDEVLVRMFAVDMLVDAGFIVHEAESAPEALEVLRRHPEVTVLFSDINMPGAFDGLELARQVHLLRPDVQLILTSGRVRPSEGDMPDADFVPKPYNHRVVPELIRTANKAAGISNG